MLRLELIGYKAEDEFLWMLDSQSSKERKSGRYLVEESLILESSIRGEIGALLAVVSQHKREKRWELCSFNKGRREGWKNLRRGHLMPHMASTC